MNRLTCAITKTCLSSRIDEKWLLAPNLRVGHQWIETVVRSGHSVVNVRIKTLKAMALELAGPEMAVQGLRLSSPRAHALLIHQVLRELKGRLKYLAESDLNPRLAETILSSIESLRLAGIGLPGLTAGHFEVTDKAEDLAQIMNGYLSLIQAEKMADYAWVLDLAVQRLSNDPQCLPADVLVLIPNDLPRCAMETRLLHCIPNEKRQELEVDQPDSARFQPPQSDRDLLRWLMHPADAPEALSDGTVKLVRAVGEVNEVRAVLRTCMAKGVHWDAVELLHTDTSTFVPLVYETFMFLDRGRVELSDDLPVTFHEGISCRYSRPGRALNAWLQWMDEESPQSQLVTMIKEGLLEVPVGEQDHSGFSRLARLLRSVGIGFGRDRYKKKLADAVHSLESKLLEMERGAGDGDDDEVSPAKRDAVLRDLRDMRVLHTLVDRLLDTCPNAGANGHGMITNARKFIQTMSRCVSKLDRFAAESLVQQLADMEQWLSGRDSYEVDVREWLIELATDTRVMGSGPRPGCLHVDSLSTGGHSGREHTFIVGLDDSRFPGAGLQDPLLLDSERRKLSAEIPTAAGRLDERLADFVRLVARLRGTVTLSYSCQDVVEDREMFPSSVILSVYRLISGHREGEHDDLLKWMGTPVSFAPIAADHCLDPTEWWLWRLTGREQVSNSRDFVWSQFPHLARGATAVAERLGARFTEYDGYVPQAGEDLDPTKETGHVMSSNQLQTVGECPRKYFFRYGLDIAPPEDVPLDPDKWLNDLAFGSLMHALFEEFVREVLAGGRVPHFHADYPRLQQLLLDKVAQYRDLYPPLNEASFHRRVAQLTATARTFLREDERYCMATHSVPVYLEASIGLSSDGHDTDLDSADPVPLSLPNGKVIRVRGRVDRIDRIGNGAVQTYAIWDYKSGSDYGYDRADPFRQGRKVQPFVYVTLVGHRLRNAVSPQARVECFGFFFPGVKTVGERLQWTPHDLACGEEVMRHLCQLITDGVFVATDHFEHDCKFCDYQGICGDGATVSAAVKRKLGFGDNCMLQPFRALRPTLLK